MEQQPKVLCKKKSKETRLVVINMSGYECPLCKGNDRQAEYYDNHEFMPETEITRSDGLGKVRSGKEIEAIYPKGDLSLPHVIYGIVPFDKGDL